MRYTFYTCDVFTETRFGGNPLAVLPEAEGLSAEQMQQVAREFNFSESTFVLPPEKGHSRRVRIFTPSAELPFAGHPNVGTAFVLATAGVFGEIESGAVEETSVVFEEEAGLVPISIQRRGAFIHCELSAPESLSMGPTLPAETLAAALSLELDDFVSDTHPPQVASVGLPFLFAELKDRAALERARVDMAGFEVLASQGAPPCVHLYVRSEDEFDIRARMFAPLDEMEDPATGSANCALAGLLSHCDEKASGSLHFRIAQGVEMGRPSVLEARAEKRGGSVAGTWVGGTSVLVSEGLIEVGS